VHQYQRLLGVIGALQLDGDKMKVTIMNHYINKEEKGFSAFVNKCIGFFTKSNAWQLPQHALAGFGITGIRMYTSTQVQGHFASTQNAIRVMGYGDTYWKDPESE